MRILMTADAVGGVWTYSLELARELQQSGCEVVIATMGVPPSPAQRAAASAAHIKLCESRYALEWMADPWADIARAGAWLLELEAKLQPDIVHLNQFAPGALPFTAPTLLVGHSCVLSWWRAVHGEEAPPGWQRYREVVAAGLDGAGMVAAPSAAMLETLTYYYNTPTRAQVIHNGRDPRRFPPGVKRNMVLSAGRLWDPAKNASAVARVARALPWPVFVAGEQCHPDGSSLSLAGARLLGQLSEPALAQWYGRAAVYALPARYEPFGLTALEAALAGCALVLGDIPSLREVWQDDAMFVHPDDGDALHDALTLLILDEERRLDMAKRARRRAIHFSSRRMADRYRTAYASLAQPATASQEAACA
jgi:glycogen synthase